MKIIYRSKENRPLTCDEVDGNFQELENRIKALRGAAVDAESIAVVEQQEGKLQFKGTRGSDLGTVELPKLFWNLKGKWQPETRYAFLDVVVVENALYVCQEAHISSKQFSIEKRWRHMFTFQQPESKLSKLPSVQTPQSPSSQGNMIQAFRKDELPKKPSHGILVLIVDAPTQPDLFHWSGKEWVRVRDGRSLGKLSG